MNDSGYLKSGSFNINLYKGDFYGPGVNLDDKPLGKAFLNLNLLPVEYDKSDLVR